MAAIPDQTLENGLIVVVFIELEQSNWLWGLLLLAPVWLLSLSSRALLARRARVTCAVLRSIVLVLLIMALARPSWIELNGRPNTAALALVVDRSLSVAEQNAETDARLQTFKTDFRGLGPIHELNFARSAWLTGETPLGLDGSHIELGLERARCELAGQAAGAVVLFTDGRATTGNAPQAAAALRAQGKNVHVVSIGRHQARGPHITGVEPPTNARLGQPAQVLIRVRSDTDEPYQLKLLDGRGIEVDQSRGHVQGEVVLVLHYLPHLPGLQNCKVILTGPEADATPESFAEAPIYVEGPPRVLAIDPFPTEIERLVSSMRDTGIQVEVRSTADAPPSYDDLAGYDAVVLSDCPQLEESLQAALARYVEETAGGLLFIGGSNVRTASWHGSSLETALPIDFLPEEHQVIQKTRPAHVCFVLDKSGSMSEALGIGSGSPISKLDMVKAAVQRSIAELPPDSTLSIVVFDAATTVLVNRMPVSRWSEVADRLDGLEADGGTVMDIAVATGIDLLDAEPPRYMIVLTDGQTQVAGPGSPRHRWAQLLVRIRKADVSLATIAVGKDADRQLLGYLARQANGVSYYCESADEIPKVFIREAQTIKQLSRAESPPFRPRPGADARLLRGISLGSMPLLVKALPAKQKNLAQVVLTSDRSLPVLALWQYGTGRIAAFTSDVKPVWSRSWFAWSDFGRFWNQVLTWVLRPANHVQADIEPVVEGSDVRLLLRVTDEDGRAVSGLTGSGSLFPVACPEEEGTSLDCRELHSGVYEAKGTLSRPGNHLCRLQLQSQARPVFSHTLLLQAARMAELAETGPDSESLASIAMAGGGLLDPTPQQVRESLVGSVEMRRPLTHSLWPMLVLAAIVVWLLDVATRRVMVLRSG